MLAEYSRVLSFSAQPYRSVEYLEPPTSRPPILALPSRTLHNYLSYPTLRTCRFMGLRLLAYRAGDRMALKLHYRTATVLPFLSSCQSIVFSVRRSILPQNQRRAYCNVGQGNPFIKVSEEVRDAVETQKPVVALETTIYTHGG